MVLHILQFVLYQTVMIYEVKHLLYLLFKLKQKPRVHILKDNCIPPLVFSEPTKENASLGVRKCKCKLSAVLPRCEKKSQIISKTFNEQVRFNFASPM